MAYLSLKSVSKKFSVDAGAFDIDLDVDKGEAVCLLGASGCGKTTLLRIVAGLIAPDTGAVWIAGKDVTTTPTHSRDIGMVFQTWALFPHLTVRKNVEFGLSMRGVSGGERAERANHMLAMVGLSPLADRRPHQLSGGQQQRVALARALAINPQVLLLDEPMSSLDFNTRVELRRELRLLQQKLAVTTIYVTHDYSEALAVADRTVLMRHGRIMEQGATQQLFERPRTRFGARFLGLHNLVPGRILSSDGVKHKIALGSEMHSATGVVPVDGADIDIGETVVVGFDEWSASFHPTVETAKAASALPVSIVSSNFEHGYTRIVVEAAGFTEHMKLRMPGFHGVESGTTGFLLFDWSNAWIISDEQRHLQSYGDT